MFIRIKTYAVYLLHNWLFGYMGPLFAGSMLQNRLYAFIFLLIISVFLMKVVENPGIKFQRNLLGYFRKISIFYRIMANNYARVQ